MQARGYESQPHGLSCADGLTSTSAGKCGCRKFGHVADLRFWVMPSTDWVLVEARWPCASCNASVAHEVSVGTGEPDAGQLEHRISATPGSADHETSRSRRRTEFRTPPGRPRERARRRERGSRRPGRTSYGRTRNLWGAETRCVMRRRGIRG